MAVFRPDYFLVGYFVTGAWQITSMIIHRIKNLFIHPGSARSNYHYLTLVILITAAVFTLLFLAHVEGAWTGIYLLLIMLFAAPVMAIWYTVICYTEYRALKDRELVQLR